MNYFFHLCDTLIFSTVCIKRAGCKNLFYSVTDVWLEATLQQNLNTLSDSCREIMKVEFYMLRISPFFSFMYAALSLTLTGAVLDIVVVSRM